ALPPSHRQRPFQGVSDGADDRFGSARDRQRVGRRARTRDCARPRDRCGRRLWRVPRRRDRAPRGRSRVRPRRAHPGESAGRAVQTPSGVEIETLRPPTAVDLRFVLEAVTNSTAEHLELFAALTSFFHRNPYLTIARDPAAPEGETVRFVLAADGEARA